MQVLHSEIVRIYENLVQQTSNSRSEFWFFQESDIASYAEELSERLIVSKPIAKYPILLFDENCGLEGSMAGIPTLVFVFLGSSGEVVLEDQMVSKSCLQCCLFRRVRT